MKKALNLIVGILFLIALICNGLQFYYIKHFPSPEVIKITDTITLTKDSIVEKIKWKTKFDTIIDLQYKDTTIHDTIEIPIEHKVSEFNIKKDSFELKQKIHHSGFHSVIDSVECSYSFNYKVKPQKQKKVGFVWYIGIGPSGGVNFNIKDRTFDYGPSFGLQAGIGIGGTIK